jgi:chitinase
MAYDLYGGWMKNTGHAAPLYTNGKDPQALSTNDMVNAYLKAFVPANKIVLGVSLYGQGANGVADGGMHGLFQPVTGKWLDPASLSWTTIKSKYLAKGSGFTSYWDDTSKASYLYNPDLDGGTFITYTSADEIKAINKYVKDRGLGGVMVWEDAFDLDGDMMKVLAENAMPDNK